MKRKVQAVQCLKKLRSRLPRRRRSQISPIICSNVKPRSIAFPVDSSASSHLTREVSCDSSRVSVNKPRPHLKKRGLEEIGGFGENEEFRRVTRSYLRQRENERKEVEKRRVGDGVVEISESSCVESCSGVKAREINSKSKRTSGKGAGNAKEFGRIEESGATTKSEVSCVQQFSGEFSRKISKAGGEKARGTENSLEIKENKLVLFSDKANNDGENRVPRVELFEVSRNYAEANLTDSNSGLAIEQKSELNANDLDLACSEYLCNEAESDYSSAFSDLQSEIFPESSEVDFSDYTPSVWFESGSEFSERSVGDENPTPTFSLFLQYAQQFYKSTSALGSKISTLFDEEHSDEFTPLRFEDDEHERSYQMFRDRERRQVYVHDYTAEYCSTTEHGELVIQQRLHMVHWIVEQSTTKELQKETMFLGISLLDRFLSKGFFKNKRSLQIVGIACLALATRIEENQPFNSVRERKFSVGSNVYSRCEVVAMEWLVQEVLDFQCFLPTIYNFLWFYLKAASANEVVEKTVKYLAVLALLGHEQLCYWPSTVAAGLVMLASLSANQDASCNHVMETHLRTKDDDLPGCIKSLQWLVRYAY
ncbi:cyclin-SDS [Camellia sinensis]|uniref:cyclin-SDS n=1 Tax=Camellia sinensis TaxID=4442 RepID=UPI001036B549|nr:cyclin-SDS [Camellia sinensis]